MKKIFNAFFITLLTCCLFFSTACTINFNSDNTLQENSNNASQENVDGYLIHTERYQVVSAPMENGPIVCESFTDGKANYYMLDLGYVKNVPLSSGSTIMYNGQTPITISIEKSQITEKTVEEAVEKTVSESTTVSSSGSASFSVGCEIGNQDWWGKIKLEASYSRYWGTSTEKAYSTSNTWTTAESCSNSISESLTTTIGSNKEKAGYYRLSMFATCDLFALVETNLDNSQMTSITYVVCARDNPKFVIDYDETGENFDCSTDGEVSKKITLATDFYKVLPKPTKTSEDFTSCIGEVVTSSFTAEVWAENRKLGTAIFSVTGIKVKYNGKYYVYGNAWYRGILGEDRFNDVDSIFLKESTKNILLGGIFYWRSSPNDNNESGVASWNKNLGMDSNSISYMPEDPGKDISPKEEISLSITDICVEYQGSATQNDKVPEIATTTLSADFTLENNSFGKITFDVIGIKVKYENRYYIMGNAFYSDNMGGQRFNDVANIYLNNCDKKILFGGTLGWRGSVSDNNESGICAFDKNGGFDTTRIRYMMEDPGKDFAGNEDAIISISGICVNIEGDATNDLFVPTISTTSFSASITCESSPNGNANFTCVGIETTYNGETYIYGNAYYSSNPGGNRFNDIGSLKISVSTKNKVLVGGLLHLYGSYSDNNESGVLGFSKADSTGSKIVYMPEDPGKDFAGDKTISISITGILVKK